MRLRKSFLAGVSLLLSACVPEFDDDLSVLREPRILALQSEPAEAAEGTVRLTALVAVPPDSLESPSPDWALCLERKPLTELGPVSPRCLAAFASGGPPSLPLGAGTHVSATLPADACRLFGPIRPEPKPGEPAGRPVDPDSTGGYYQPFISALPGTDGPALGAVRLACGIEGALQAQIVEFNSRYVANGNPAPAAFELVRDGESIAIPADPLDGAAPTEVAAGERVQLRVTWPACPREAQCGDAICSEGESASTCAEDCTGGNACAGAESYAWFDPDAKAVVSRRESLRVSWFSSSGQLAEERTGRSESEADVNFSENAWRAPRTSGGARIWVIVRDDRGGVGWQSHTFEVR
ncbi:MAG TPA: hypothetical protein VK524_01220 [Polyangiaceae bacterium]|nr:hypothetical protein [Polyangiaceae bacterium]